MDVKGSFVGFTEAGHFRYIYACEQCGCKFSEACPEVSSPAICHRCLIGPRYKNIPSVNRVASNGMRRVYKTKESC